jgi:hypothetical protein
MGLVEKNLLNFKDIKLIKKTPEYMVFLAREARGSENVFIKIPSLEENKQFIEREYVNQLFLHKLSKCEDCGFEFLEPRMRDEVLVYPDISKQVTWLGQTSPEKKDFQPTVEPIDKYLKQMIKLQKALLKVEYNILPDFIKQDWQSRKKGIINNLNNDAQFLYKHKLISNKERKSAEESLDEKKIKWNYQHHDIVPWHIGRVNDSLFLVDAGWAGWSMRYFDIVYYALQMIGYAGREEDAQKMLRQAKSEFDRDSWISENLKRVAWYRGIRLARELFELRKYPSGANKVLEFIRYYKY